MSTLHLPNKPPIDYFSKNQPTGEMAACGLERVAIKMATEQIINLRNLTRFLRVPIQEGDYFFGDDKAVVKSTSILDFKFHKRHIVLSCPSINVAITFRLLVFQDVYKLPSYSEGVKNLT